MPDASGHGRLALWKDCAAGREAVFERWYRDEHFIERVSVPGFREGRRYWSLTGNPRYFTYYITDGPAVLWSDAYKTRLADPTPLTTEIMSGVLINMNRTICRCAGRWGPFRGAWTITTRWDDPALAEPAAAEAEALAREAGVARTEIWTAVDDPTANSDPNSGNAEEALRGPDARIAGCLVVEAFTQTDAHRLAERLMAASWASALTPGIYALLYTLRNEELSR